MIVSRKTAFKGGTLGRLGLACAGLVLAVSAAPALAEHPATTLATLLDRAQIEDMLVEYYGRLGASQHDLGSYYVEDGVLDVNGLVSKGKKAIDELYKTVSQAAASELRGTFHMLITNPLIVVNGDSATADVIWTGIRSETVKSTPQFVEQGREHDELVKRGGKWYFKLRVISSDAGLPPMFEKYYKPR